jgi:NAD(P)H-dependent FMN reductase
MLGLVRVSGGAMGASWVMNSLREVGRALDPQALPQFGLVAEQGATVDPELLALDNNWQ